jgi:hypothetical protein
MLESYREKQMEALTSSTLAGRLFRQTYRNNGHLRRTSQWSALIQHEELAGFGAFAFTV